MTDSTDRQRTDSIGRIQTVAQKISKEELKTTRAKDVLPSIKHTQNAVFLSLVTLTFDLDIQTRPSEGPNTSSV